MEINQEEWEARLSSDLSRVCRLCLKNCDAIHPIFNIDEPENGQTLSHKIMACAQVKVFEGDGLPTHVCKSCYGQVERSYQFKLLCERSDSKLRGSIVRMNGSSDTDEVDDSDEVDMTQLTPEVIINEDINTAVLAQDGGHRNAESNGDVYAKIMQSVLESNTSSNNNTPVPLGQPKYLQGLPGFVHSNQEMARMAIAMALHQRSVQEKERKVEEMKRQAEAQIKQQQFFLRQKRAAEDGLLSGPSSKSRRCRNGVKAFKCTQCNKSYSFSSALSRHKAVHNPQLRPHFCTICKKGFTQVEKFLRHQRTHALDSASLFNATMAYNNKMANSYLGLSAQTSSSSSLPLSLVMKPLMSTDPSELSVSRLLKTERREVNYSNNPSINPSLSNLHLLKSKMSKGQRQIDLPAAQAEHLEISIKPEHLYPDSDDIDEEEDDGDEQDLNKDESIKSEEFEDTSVKIKKESDEAESRSEHANIHDNQNVIHTDLGTEPKQTEDANEKASHGLIFNSH